MRRDEARKRARELTAKMTLEEKASQMLYESPAIERLGLPEYNWWNEALHGVARAGLSTVFPQAIGLSASFDPEVTGAVGRVVGEEGRLKNTIYRSENDRDIYKGLTFWSPNINIVRDPRWGRAHESYGEDPCLNALMGIPFVKGIQEYADGREGLQAAACAKHFAVHSGPESIRHGFNAVVSEQDLRETYLPAFEKLVKDGKTAGVMSAYNAINGTPSSADPYLLRDILREEWGFDGYTVSDCGAVSDISEKHHYVDTKTEAAAAAVEAGCELNCGNVYAYVCAAVQKGLLDEKRVEEAVEDLLTIRLMLEMDEPVSQEEGERAIHEWMQKKKEWDVLNERIAEKTMVLLKNDGILPLESPRCIAVVGPDADSRTVLEGNYHGTAGETTTIAEGLRAAFPEAELLVSEGSHLYRNKVEFCTHREHDRVSEARAFARAADVTIAVLGLDPSIEGELGDASNEYAAGDKRDLRLPESQRVLLENLCEVSGRVVVVLTSGGALDLGDCQDKVSAIVQAWYPGSEGGKAVAGVLSGRVNPTGRLPVTFYHNEDVTWDFSDYAMEGKTYRFFEGEPLYPFGFGLSYRSLTVESAKKTDSGIRAMLYNPHTKATSMPLEVYVEQSEEGLRTPKRQLCALQYITLEAGERKEVFVPIDPYWEMVVDEAGKRRKCRGISRYFVGDHQPDERSEALALASGKQRCLPVEEV